MRRREAVDKADFEADRAYFKARADEARRMRRKRAPDGADLRGPAQKK
jgi:hypothetical protein